MFGANAALFQRYTKGKFKAIYPWSLSIVDCFFLVNAFRSEFKAGEEIGLIRISKGGNQIDQIFLKNAYDLYGVDTDADGFEIVLLNERSGASCYWDLHERFVVASGAEDFIAIARPYPKDIEKHRYVEAMLHLEQLDELESPESIYMELDKV